MKKIISLFCLSILCIAAKPSRPGGDGSTPFVLWKWNSSGAYVASGDGASWSFPLSGHNVAYCAFDNTTTVTNVLGDLTGKTVSATYTIAETGSPDYVWGGLLSGWNTGGLPANARLFISTSSAGYSNSGYTACPNCYWWSHTWSELGPGQTVITDTFDPSNWSNANGHTANEPDYLAAFQSAIANVHQIGLALSGGSFFDVGVAIRNGTGNATFTLNSFTAQ